MAMTTAGKQDKSGKAAFVSPEIEATPKSPSGVGKLTLPVFEVSAARERRVRNVVRPLDTSAFAVFGDAQKKNFVVPQKPAPVAASAAEKRTAAADTGLLVVEALPTQELPEIEILGFDTMQFAPLPGAEDERDAKDLDRVLEEVWYEEPDWADQESAVSQARNQV
jgi:hypothetical protein